MKHLLFTLLITLCGIAPAVAQDAVTILPTLSAASGVYDDQLTVTCHFPEGCAGGRWWTAGGEICSHSYDGPIAIDRDCTLSVAGTDGAGRIITDVVSATYTIRRVTPPSYTTLPCEGRRKENFYVTRLVWDHVGEVMCNLSDFKPEGSRHGQPVVWLTDADGRTLTTGDANNLWLDGRNTYKVYLYRNYEQTRPGLYTLHIAGGIFSLDGVVRQDPIELVYEVSNGDIDPEFSPTPGTYKGNVEVTINYPSEDIAFYPLYKLNGGKATRYNGPITLTETTTIQAYYMDEQATATSTPVTATYTIVPADPAPLPLEAPVITRTGDTTFTITGPSGATLKYWVNSRMSTATLYTGPITLSDVTRLSAVAYTAASVSPTVDLDIPAAPSLAVDDRGTLTLVTPLITETAHLRSLSPDGRWAVGYTGDDTSSRGFIWDLEADNMSYAQTPYINQLWAVADDGTAFGWRTRDVEVDDSAGEDAFLWGAFAGGVWTEMTADAFDRNAGITPLPDAPSGYPAATHVSPDGTWAILGDAYRYCIPTGTVEALPSTRTISTSPRPEVLTCIADDGLIFGTYDPSLLSPESGVALVYTLDGRWRDAADWLLDTYGVTPPADFTLSSVRAVTGDHTTILCHARRSSFSTADAFTRGLVIRLNTQIAHLAPCAVSAAQMTGLNLVRISWQAPIAGADDIVAYTLLRDGAPLASLSADTFSYFDDTVTSGSSYVYTITATYADGTVSAPSRAATVVCDLVSHLPVRDLTTRRVGLADLVCEWKAPQLSMPRLQYFDDAAEHYAFGTGSYDAEFGIRIPASDITPYADGLVRTFQFIPTGAQHDYTLSFYSGRPGAKEPDYDTTPFYTQSIDPSTLHYGTVNTIVLDTPQTLPADRDLYIGLTVGSAGNDNMLGISYEGFRSGYSDLCRIVGVHPTMVPISKNSSVVTEIVLPLGIGISDEAGFEASLVSGYDVTLDGTLSGTTSDLRYRFDALSPGQHTIGVTATYLDGGQGAPTVSTVEVVPNTAAYVKVEAQVETLDDGSARIHWDAPLDDDPTLIHWGDLNPSRGWEMARGSSCYVATVAFPPTVTAPYADDYAITEVFFCPLDNVLFYLAIETPEGVQLAYAAPTEVELGAINVFRLNEPVVVDPSMTYQVVAYAVTAEEGTCAIAYDSSGQWQNGFSNIINYGTGNSTLADFVQYNEHPNWLLGMIVRENDARPLAVEGYDVRLGQQQLNTVPVTDCQWVTDPLPDGEYDAAVDVHYTDFGLVRGDGTPFDIGATGLRPIVLSADPITHRFDISGRRTTSPSGLSIEQNGRKSMK